jgi:diaminopimelate epimerase
VRVWERAAGETLSCGTGTCAAVAVTSSIGLTDPNVNVTMRGGTLHVEWLADRTMALTGPAEFVYKGSMSK